MGQTPNRLFVVISGIPGSGKTTLGRKLAAALGLPFIDKDEILEALFEREGTGDAVWRRKLSRQSDEELARTATTAEGAVIVSFWRTNETGADSGTPTNWLRELPGRVLEIHCVCDPRVAADRFNRRVRHAGHGDQTRPAADAAHFRRLAGTGPLDVGEVIPVQTSGGYDLEPIMERLRALR